MVLSAKFHLVGPLLCTLPLQRPRSSSFDDSFYQSINETQPWFQPPPFRDKPYQHHPPSLPPCLNAFSIGTPFPQGQFLREHVSPPPLSTPNVSGQYSTVSSLLFTMLPLHFPKSPKLPRVSYAAVCYACSSRLFHRDTPWWFRPIIAAATSPPQAYRRLLLRRWLLNVLSARRLCLSALTQST